MRAAVRERFGRPEEVIDIRDVPVPEPARDEVLVRVSAASINPAEWYSVVGRPWVGRFAMGLLRPKSPLLGWDFAGTVEAVGAGVADFRPGDEVFGGRSGALAEFVRVGKAVAHKPSSITMMEAAGVPTAGLTALQGLRDKGSVTPGSRVLVNGASGGVGTFAVQIAKALGAEVTAVCSTANVDQVGALGADLVIDYTREDFTRGGGRYDVLLDVAGNRSWAAYRRALEPLGTLVVVGGSKRNRLLGPLSHVIGVQVAALPSRRKATFFVATPKRSDLETLGELIEAGRVTPVVDRTYPLSEIVDAFAYLAGGHARGKIVITL